MLERLHKVLARAGVAALRPAEEMIMAGHVTVNGRVVRELGARVDPDADVIAVDGELIELRKPSDPFHYVAVHKPLGVISTARDTHDRPTVLGLVPSNARLFPVGRLDGDSEGLILLTDDGDIAFRLTHPRFEVEKEYRVLLDRTPQTEDLRRWREGVELEGELTMPAWIEILERTSEGTWLRVVMREGRKRQIREVARLLGYTVLRLVRVREGPITLGDLSPGAWRELSPSEVQALRAHTQHIPSRAAEEERERRMAQRDRPEGRRLRIIRGGGRDTNDEAERPSADMASEERGADRRPRPTRSYSSSDEQRRAQPPAAERRQFGRPGNPGAPGGRPGQSGGRRPMDSHAEQARRQPRAPESRADATGRRNRDVGYSGSSYRDRGNAYRGGPQRGYPARGGPRRSSEGGYEQRSGPRSGPAPERDGNRRDYGNQRDAGNQRGPGARPPYGERRPYGGQRDAGGQRGPGSRPYGERRPYGGQRDAGRQRGPGARPPYGERRPYGGQRDMGNRRPPDNQRDMGNQREPGNQRDFSNRRSPASRDGRAFDRPGGMDADRRNRPPRPGDADRSRGGYGRAEGDRRRSDERPGGPRRPTERRDSTPAGNRRDRGPEAGARSFGSNRGGPPRRPSGPAGPARNTRGGPAPRRTGPPSANARPGTGRNRGGSDPNERRPRDDE